MPYIIDGHNLIPRIPGLDLDMPDDEARLIEILQAFCRLRRKEVEVYFDNSPPGLQGTKRFGLVRAYFVRQGVIVDDVIRGRLRQLGRRARNWIVVSSDRSVQIAAREAHARVQTSDSFAGELVSIEAHDNGEHISRSEIALSEDEVEGWLKIFGEGAGGEDRIG